MGRAIRFLVLFVLVVSSAVLIPREAGRERSLRTAWVTAVPSSAISGTSNLQPGDLILPRGRTWMTIDPETGEIRAAGLRADRFSGDLSGFINQPRTSISWALQEWDGNVIRFVENRGVPQISGDLFLQFADDYVSISSIEDGRPVDLPTGVRTTALASRTIDGVGSFVARGSVRGEIALYRYESGSLIEVGAIDADLKGIGPIYALAIDTRTDDQERTQAVVAAMVGQNPQQLRFFIPDSDGRLLEERRVNVAVTRAVRSPADLSPLGADSYAVSLRDNWVIWDVDRNEMIDLGLESSDFIGGGATDEHAFLLLGGEARCSIVFIDRRSNRRLVWDGFGCAAEIADARRAIVRVGHTLVSLEFRL